MQYRLQDELVPLAMAHLMGRPTESNEKGPIRFRVQADRRRVQTLANGATDRRARRGTTVVTDEDSGTLNGRAKSAQPRVTPQD